MFKEALKTLSTGKSLDEETSYQLFCSLFANKDITDAQIGAFLMASSILPITADMLTGAARALREYMIIPENAPARDELLDTCGTGGSGLNSFNTSTAAAFVIAGAGQKVAKHGNRASTSKSGSADVLEALGVRIDCSSTTMIKCLKQSDFGFFFAPAHHQATKRVGAIRRELGFRTIFNIIGPLANPLSASKQIVGVSSLSLLTPVAEALGRLGATRAIVVHGEDGMDEITVSGRTNAIELQMNADGSFSMLEMTFFPETCGLQRHPLEAVSGQQPEESAKIIESLLANKNSISFDDNRTLKLQPYADLVCLNAGTGLFVSGRTDSIPEGIKMAQRSITSGRALEVLNLVRGLSNAES
ncbi:MAG: anthranilate phosphoribosyltransferase [bacterium]|nr:anthranilate phosphoribosyltransferase [bacterium]